MVKGEKHNEEKNFGGHDGSDPRIQSDGLYLKLFRGEPAISEFDWNFSAIHKSSPVIATNVGSVLHGVLPPLQPGHG